jgi:hypothetical protein
VDHRPDVSCLKKTTTQAGLKSLKKKLNKLKKKTSWFDIVQVKSFKIKLNNRVCYLTGKFWIGFEIQNKCRDWYTESSKLE